MEAEHAPPARIRVLDVRFHVRDVRTRMPFRFGTAVLLGSPILHLDVRIHVEGHGEARGVAADGLPIRWFDKDPAHEPARNIRDLIEGAREAADLYRVCTQLRPFSPFDLWLECAEELASRGAARDRNRLTSQHGPSLMDRAVLDALGRAEGLTLGEMVLRGRTGLRPEAVHPVLQGLDWRDVLQPHRPTHLWVRHTVGLSDPLREQDIPPQERLDDGQPQSLEACILEQGLRYFKLKLTGRPEADLERLQAIAGILDERIAEPYHVSLDGNEQYGDTASLAALVRGLTRTKRLDRLARSVLYVEQPFDRAAPLDRARELGSIPYPLVIDESDDGPQVFARAAQAGYLGVSSKSCKGLYKSLLNALLVEHLNREHGVGRYFLTAEDLMNPAVVPLHQDTSLVAFLGIPHAERNGHHYLRGLDHLSEAERLTCLERHAGLYEKQGSGARIAVRAGRMDIRSLRVPGLGVGMDTDFASMRPLKEWLRDQGA